MGVPNIYSSRTWDNIQSALKSRNIDPFSMSRQVLSGATSIDDYINPRIKGVRRCADVPDKGIEKTPIAVCIDLTGSGRTTPCVVRDDLPQLMGLLQIKKDIFPDILFSGFGDIECDSYPAQMPQFESDAEQISRALSCLVLEGGGGGNMYESYTEMLYALGYKTQLDSVKRGIKGTAVIIGDELPRPVARMRDLNSHWLSDEERVTRDFTLSEIVAKVRENWNIYYVICRTTSYWDDPTVEKAWRDTLGYENFIRLENPEDISELIASLVLMNNGVSVNSITSKLVEMGEGRASQDIGKALVAISNNGGNNPIVSQPNRPTRLSRF
jgi:hypothetical protein